MPALKFRTRRDADAVARSLVEHGYEVEWVRRNHGAQRELTWNVRLAGGAEIHNTQQLAEMGIRVQPAHGRKTFYGPPDYGVSLGLSAGAWTVVIAWKERGEPASTTCGHRHRTSDAAWRCASMWQRRVRSAVEQPSG